MHGITCRKGQVQVPLSYPTCTLSLQSPASAPVMSSAVSTRGSVGLSPEGETGALDCLLGVEPLGSWRRGVLNTDGKGGLAWRL